MSVYRTIGPTLVLHFNGQFSLKLCFIAVGSKHLNFNECII